MTSERRKQLLSEFGDPAYDGDRMFSLVSSTMTIGEARELLQAHKELETIREKAEKQRQRLVDAAETVHRVGLNGGYKDAFCDAMSALRSRIVETLHNVPAEPLADYAARTGAGTTAREGGGDG